MMARPWKDPTKRKLLYMWQPPGASWEDSIAIPKSQLVDYHHRALQTPGKLWYVWAETAGHARYYLRIDPEVRKQSYKVAKQAEREMVKRVKIKPSKAEQLRLFGTFGYYHPLDEAKAVSAALRRVKDAALYIYGTYNGLTVTTVPPPGFQSYVIVKPSGEVVRWKRHRTGWQTETLRHAYPLPQPKKRKAKAAPGPSKQMKLFGQDLSGDIMTCAEWDYFSMETVHGDEKQSRRCLIFQPTCSPPGEPCLLPEKMRGKPRLPVGKKKSALAPVKKKRKKRIMAPPKKGIKEVRAPDLPGKKEMRLESMTTEQAASEVLELRQHALKWMKTQPAQVWNKYIPAKGHEITDEVALRALSLRDKNAFQHLLVFRTKAISEKWEKKRDYYKLPPVLEPAKKETLTKPEKMILDALGTEIIHIDEIGRKTGLKAYMISSGLVMLELKGMVQQSAGKMFQTKKVTQEGTRLTEPWEMSAKDWKSARDAARKAQAHDEVLRLHFDAHPTLAPGKMPEIEHRAVIEKAYKAGKTVPARVLKEYPDITKEHRTPKELKAQGPWMTAAPFTKAQMDDYNRYTHYPIQFNDVFSKEADAAQKNALRDLNDYGIEKMTVAVRNAVDAYRKKLYEYYLAKFALQSYLPPPSVVGPAKWPAHKRAKANQREKKMIDTIKKARGSMERVISDAVKGLTLVKTKAQWLDVALGSTRLSFGKVYAADAMKGKPLLEGFGRTLRKKGRELHEELIAGAVNQGTPIPWEAIKDYPDLQLKAIILRKPAEAVVGKPKKPHWSKKEKDEEKAILDALRGKKLNLLQMVKATGLDKSKIILTLVRLKSKSLIKWSKEKDAERTLFEALSGLGGDISHCGAWGFDQTRGLYYCVAQGPSCEAQKTCAKPVLSPGRQNDIKRHTRILKDSIAAKEKLNVRVGELRARANRDFHSRLTRIGVHVDKGDRVDTEDPAVKKIAAELLVGYQPRLDKFNYALNAATKHINRANRVLAPKKKKKQPMKACSRWKKVWSTYYNAKIDRCAAWKAACEAGACLPEPTRRPALPEPSASEVKSVAEFMAEDYKTPPGAKRIGKDILERSGLKNYRTRPGEKPDHRYNELVPVALRRKGGLTPDEMADEMKLPGGDVELYALIQKAYPHMHGRGGKAGAAARKREREIMADWHYWKDTAFEELQEELMRQL